jgi:hypothetical protein
MRAGKVLALCLFTTSIATTLAAQGLFLGDYRAYAAARITGINALPQASSYGNVTFYVLPVNWVRFRAQAGFLISDFAQFAQPDRTRDQSGEIDLEGLAFELPSVFGSKQSISLYSGYYDDLSSDSMLRSELKLTLDTPEFRSLPAGNIFLNDADAEGIGCAVLSHPFSTGLALGAYAWTNGVSNDLTEFSAAPRVVMHADFLKANAFAGIKMNIKNTSVKFRGGFSALLSAPSGQELYMQAGINQFSANEGEAIGKKVYVLFEPRLHFEWTDLSIAFFSSPVTSTTNSLLTGDYLGANALLAVGSIAKQGMRGGISVLGMIDPEDPGTVTPFTFSITPFYTFRVSENIIAVSVMMNPLVLQSPGAAVEAQISLKAAY